MQSSTTTTTLRCEREKLDVDPLAAILEILRSGAFKERVDRLDGYDPASCGELVEVCAGSTGRKQASRQQLRKGA